MGRPLTKLKLCIRSNQSSSQAMRWDPLSNVGSQVISCETASRGMLSQIRDRRDPAFSTHAHSWLFTQSLVAGSLGLIQEQNGDSVF